VIPATSAAELSYLWPINWLGLHRQYLNPGEMEVIAALLRQVAAQSMLEIGCRDGRTARVLLSNVTSLKRYVGVDVPMTYEPGLAMQRAEMVPDPGALVVDDPRFKLIVRTHGSLDLRVGDMEQVDACFIDGDHSEEVVYRDSFRALTLVRNGGVIIWHDYTSNYLDDVTKTLNRLKKEGWPIQHVAGTWLAYRMVEPDDA